MGKHCFVLLLMTELLLIFKSDSALMLILNSLRIPQFAVEKYVGNLQNGELKYNPATWGSHEFGIIPLILAYIFKPAIWGSAMLVLKNINFENSPVCRRKVFRKAAKWGTKPKILHPGEATN